MNLRETLEQYKGQLVKIGAAEAFLYIHEVDDTTEQALLKIEKNVIESLKEKISRYTLTYDNAENYIMTQVRRARKYLSEEEHENPITEKNLARYEMLAALSEHQINEMIKETKHNAKRKLKNVQNKLDTFKPLMERTVKDIYPSLEEINEGTVIIIEGTEQGEYWFKNEYRD